MASEIKLPCIFLRQLTVFPEYSVTLMVGRTRTRRTILAARARGIDRIVVATQLQAARGEVNSLAEVFTFGTICRIERAIELADGGMQVQVCGEERVRISEIEFGAGETLASISVLPAPSCGQRELADLKSRALALLERRPGVSNSQDTLSLIRESGSAWEAIGLICELLAADLPEPKFGSGETLEEPERRRIDAHVARVQQLLELDSWEERLAQLYAALA